LVLKNGGKDNFCLKAFDVLQKESGGILSNATAWKFCLKKTCLVQAEI
jgi:hypothetical protein